MPAAELPGLVSDYLGRALPAGAVAGTSAADPDRRDDHEAGSEADPLHATERFAVERTAFVWEARFRVARLLALAVTDGFDGGGGVLKVRVFGLPLRTNSSREVVIGEAAARVAGTPDPLG